MRAGPKIARAIVPALCVFLSIFSSGQTQTGRIAGTVRDAQGALIIGAEVAAENLATADKRSVISDDAGSYSIPFLSPASYSLKIEAKGFTSTVFHNISLCLGETTTVNA